MLNDKVCKEIRGHPIACFVEAQRRRKKNNTCSTADVASQFASCYRSCKLCLAFGSFIRDSFLQWQMFPNMHSKNNSLFLPNS